MILFGVKRGEKTSSLAPESAAPLLRPGVNNSPSAVSHSPGDGICEAAKAARSGNGRSLRLASLSLFFLALLVTLHCSDDIPILKEEGAEQGSTIRISNFERKEYNAVGQPEMQVKAREAYIYESGEGANKTQERLVGYDFEYTDIDGADTTILTAKKAEMNQKTGQMYMTGNVHLKGVDREIRGEALYYDMENKIARSDSPVYIKEGEISTHCRGGVVMYMKQEKDISLMEEIGYH